MSTHLSYPSSAQSHQEPPSYTARLLDGLRLLNEARRAAAHPDSIFIWIPKNAGTSVYTVLRRNGLILLKNPRSVRILFHSAGRVTFGHMSISTLVDTGIVSPDFVAGAFKFAFVRDPYARAVSLYRYLSGTTLLNWHERPSFGDFLRLLADNYYDRIGPYNERGLSQCNPQVRWLQDTPADKVYRVENLREFVVDISQRWGIAEPEIPQLNRSTAGFAPTLAHEEKALIEEIYAEDFDTFGYAKR